MFTGIVEEIGTVTAVRNGAASARITIDAGRAREGAQIGDSIAVSGVCLTVVAIEQARLSFDAVAETLARSNLNTIRAGDRVNLERSLAAGQRMGGHFVQGHVDGVARLVSIREDGGGRVLRFEPQKDLMRYVAPKGSVALDGISLTVAEVGSDSFLVWIIPHTLVHTTLGIRGHGDVLNLETDMLARYLDRLISVRGDGISLDLIGQAGFE